MYAYVVAASWAQGRFSRQAIGPRTALRFDVGACVHYANVVRPTDLVRGVCVQHVGNWLDLDVRNRDLVGITNDTVALIVWLEILKTLAGIRKSLIDSTY